MKYCLELNKLALMINIGVLEFERNIPQLVEISLKISSDKFSKCLESDEIGDTICYNELTNLISKFCLNNEFKLIEHLCYKLFNIVKEHISEGYKLELTVTKVKPPIKCPNAGASYTISSLY